MDQKTISLSAEEWNSVARAIWVRSNYTQDDKEAVTMTLLLRKINKQRFTAPA